MNKGYQYNPTLSEILWTFIKLINGLLSLLSPRLAEKFYSFCSKYLHEEASGVKSRESGVKIQDSKLITQEPVLPKETRIEVEAPVKPAPTVPVKEEAEKEIKMITLSEEEPVVTPIPTPTAPHLAEGVGVSAETQPYIDRGPSLPEHYGEDRIVALVRDPHCIFVYWDLKGHKSQELLNYHKGPKYWSMRVRHFGEEAYHDMSINADARNWYLWVDDNKGYVIDLGFFTQHGEFVTLASSNPVHTPRAGTSQEYAEYWGFIFREVKKVTPEGVTWVSPSGRWYENWIEAHFPGSPILQTQKKGQGK